MDVHLAASLFLHYSGYCLPDWPTNTRYKRLKPFLTKTGQANKGHYPSVISLIEFKPIMNEGIKKVKHLRGGFFNFEPKRG